MLTISHALIGASLATKIPNPAISFPLAVIAHFICDIIPHWDVGLNRRSRSAKENFLLAAADVILAVIITFLLFSSKLEPLYLFSIFFFSTLPDWMEAPYLFLNWNFFPFGSMYHFQSKLQSKLQLPFGLITQIVVVAFFIFLAD